MYCIVGKSCGNGPFFYNVTVGVQINAKFIFDDKFGQYRCIVCNTLESPISEVKPNHI